MPDNPPPGAAQDAAVVRAAALTPEQIEDVLAEFRGWLRELPADTPSPQPPAETVGLHTLVAQFTALRHEVNLQTRAVRGQQEQTAEALKLLTETVEALEERDESPAEDDRLRGLLKGLVDLYDALALARRELERVREASSSATFARADEPLPDVPATPQLSFWDRLWGRTSTVSPDTLSAWRQRLVAMREERRQAGLVLERSRGFVESVITGYVMSLQRLDRLLEQQGLEPMSCVGQPFDPEQMEVLEAVAGSGRPSGEVIEEVRRGYLRDGRVFRFALVRVAKN